MSVIIYFQVKSMLKKKKAKLVDRFYRTATIKAISLSFAGYRTLIWIGRDRAENLDLKFLAVLSILPFRRIYVYINAEYAARAPP